MARFHVEPAQTLAIEQNSRLSSVHVEPAQTLAIEQNSRLSSVKCWKSYQRREPKPSEQVISCLSALSNRMCLWADRRLPAVWRVLSAAGIDTEMFSSHSTRAVSCSALAEKGVALSTTMKPAGWSSDRTFTKWQEAELGNLWSTCLRPVSEQVSFTSCVRRSIQVYQMYIYNYITFPVCFQNVFFI